MSDQAPSRERFRGFVELFGEDRPFITRSEERRLLEEGISRFSLSPDEVRGIVVNVAGRNNIRLEREIDRRMLPILGRFGGKRKKISRTRFKEAAALYNDFSGGQFTAEQTKVKIKRLMEANGFRPKRGGLTFSRHWYNKLGKKKKQAQLQDD